MKRRLLWFLALLALIGSARGQTYSYRYWFDNNPATLQTGSASGETAIEIDISGLAIGSAHALHLQGLGSDGRWSPVRTTFFFLAEEGDNESVTARYWFDNDETTTQEAPTVNGIFDLDVSHMNRGIHAVHYQTFNAAGEGSPVWTAYFFLAEEGDNESVTARYWFDNDETTAQEAPTVNGIFDLDVSHMNIGIHAVHYQTFNAAGEGSPVRTTYFYMDELQLATLSCRIWIDDEEDEALTIGLTGDDIEIEAEDLSLGLHDVHVVLLDAYGQWLAEGTATFEVKEPAISITLNDLIETFSYGKDLDFSGVTGLRAYTATGFHKLTGDVMMSRVIDVPAGEGLLLMGEPGTYEVPVRRSYSYYANLLVPTTDTIMLTPTSDGYNNYLFAQRDGIDGFYLAEDGSTLAPGRAYLRIPSTGAENIRMLRMSFDDNPDNLTPIPSPEGEDATIYDLSGRRVGKPQKGVNIIRMSDGTTQKVMIK